MWGGVKATHGVNKGKVAYECKVRNHKIITRDNSTYRIMNLTDTHMFMERNFYLLIPLEATLMVVGKIVWILNQDVCRFL